MGIHWIYNCNRQFISMVPSPLMNVCDCCRFVSVQTSPAETSPREDCCSSRAMSSTVLQPAGPMVLPAAVTLAYLEYQCRDKSPEELRTSAKKYAARCMEEASLVAQRIAPASFNEEFAALMQFLYLKDLKQETDELQCHEMEVAQPLKVSEAWVPPSLDSTPSSSISSLLSARDSPLPTIFEDPSDSLDSVCYEANDL